MVIIYLWNSFPWKHTTEARKQFEKNETNKMGIPKDYICKSRNVDKSKRKYKNNEVLFSAHTYAIFFTVCNRKISNHKPFVTKVWPLSHNNISLTFLQVKSLSSLIVDEYVCVLFFFYLRIVTIQMAICKYSAEKRDKTKHSYTQKQKNFHCLTLRFEYKWLNFILALFLYSHIVYSMFGTGKQEYMKTIKNRGS